MHSKVKQYILEVNRKLDTHTDKRSVDSDFLSGNDPVLKELLLSKVLGKPQQDLSVLSSIF